MVNRLFQVSMKGVWFCLGWFCELVCMNSYEERLFCLFFSALNTVEFRIDVQVNKGWRHQTKTPAYGSDVGHFCRASHLVDTRERSRHFCFRRLERKMALSAFAGGGIPNRRTFSPLWTIATLRHGGVRFSLCSSFRECLCENAKPQHTSSEKRCWCEVFNYVHRSLRHSNFSLGY